jgi:hypothetical protein
MVPFSRHQAQPCKYQPPPLPQLFPPAPPLPPPQQAHTFQGAVPGTSPPLLTMALSVQLVGPEAWDGPFCFVSASDG